MRVLITIHNFLPAARAGSELYTYYLAKALLSIGHQVHILHAEHGRDFSKEERHFHDLRCTVIKKPLPRGFRNLFLEKDERVDAVFSQILDSFQPDIVHINHLLHLSANIPRLSQRQAIPVVFTLHDYWLQCARINLLDSESSLCEGPEPGKCAGCCQNLYSRWPIWPGSRNGVVHLAKQSIKASLHGLFEKRGAIKEFRKRGALFRDVVANTDLLIAPSQFLTDFMVKHGLPREKLVHCDHGMPRAVWSSLSKTSRHGPLRFGYVGTISHPKGVPVLLEAFNGFRDAELYIYGRESPSIFQSYSDVMAQENVHYEGQLLDKDKAAAFSHLDALIVPSILYENSPLVIREAFLAGLPVITSNIGGMAELVPDRVCGVQFRLGDPIDLRQKLSELCRNPGELDRMRHHIPRVKSMDEQVRELTAYYRSILGSKRGADLIPQDGGD